MTIPVPTSLSDTTARPVEMDPQIEMVMKMLSDVRQRVTDEAIETRRQSNDGLRAIMAKQDITNGRVNRLESDVTRLDTLIDERTSNMTCALHEAEFARMRESLKVVEEQRLPVRIEAVEKKVKDVITARSARKRSFASKLGLTATSGAGLIWLLDALWTWASKKFGG